MGKMMEWQVCIVYLKKKKTAAKRGGKYIKTVKVSTCWMRLHGRYEIL